LYYGLVNSWWWQRMRIILKETYVLSRHNGICTYFEWCTYYGLGMYIPEVVYTLWAWCILGVLLYTWIHTWRDSYSYMSDRFILGCTFVTGNNAFLECGIHTRIDLYLEWCIHSGISPYLEWCIRKGTNEHSDWCLILELVHAWNGSYVLRLMYTESNPNILGLVHIWKGAYLLGLVLTWNDAYILGLVHSWTGTYVLRLVYTWSSALGLVHT
jgi:hypothetical protein